MFTTEVRDPTGNQWQVSVLLIPRREGIGLRERFIGRWRFKRHKSDNRRWYDFVDLPILDSIDDVLLILGIIAVIGLFVVVGWPLLLLLADFIWLILVLVGALASFGIFGRPITILAQNGPQVHTWKVRGLIKAYRFKTSVVQNIAQGVGVASSR